MQFRKALVALVGVALVGSAFATVLPAAAESATYKSWVEEDDTAPFNTTEGLVFYKKASINFGDPTADKTLNHLVSLKDLSGLAYTVKDSNSYAPSYQIGISGGTKNVTYARLVWEPYQQSPSAGPNTGEFTKVENGLWWAANVWTVNGKAQPFGAEEGSQSKPQPLSFFTNYFGDDTEVDFFGVKQGSTSEITSTVTHLEFAGKNVPLGDVDKTPYDSADISAATDPLQTKLDASQSELAAIKKELAQTKADLTNKVNELAAAKADLANKEAALTSAKTDLANKEAELTTAKTDLTNKEAELTTAKTDLTNKEAELTTAKTDLTNKEAELTTAKTDLNGKEAELVAKVAELDKTTEELIQTKAALGAANSTTNATQAMVTAMRNSLYFEQAQRGVILGTKKAGKTVTAKLAHAVPGATMSYQWYVGGKKVSKATQATLLLKRTYVGKTLSVKITTTWIDASAKSHTAQTTAKYVRTTTIKG